MLGSAEWVEAARSARRVPARAALRGRTPTAADQARGATGSRRGARLHSRTTPTLRTGCSELHAATGELRWLKGGKPACPGWRVELFGDTENGGFFQTPADGEPLIVPEEDLRRPARRRAEILRCSPTSCSGSRGSTATTSWRGRRSAVYKEADPRRASERPLVVRVGARRGFRPLSLAPARDRDRRATRQRRREEGAAPMGPARRDRVRAGRGRSTARGEVARRRKAGGVCLRAVHLPRAGHRPARPALAGHARSWDYSSSVVLTESWGGAYRGFTETGNNKTKTTREVPCRSRTGDCSVWPRCSDVLDCSRHCPPSPQARRSRAPRWSRPSRSRSPSKNEFHFTLSTSKVPRSIVTFKITNDGNLPHDFEICNSNKGGTSNSCAGKKTTLISGQGGTGKLVKTFVLKGKYEYLCTVPGHAAQGMKGLITVT